MTSLEAFPAALQPWQNFYILTGTAAATLTGLMFVAVTFGASLVTRDTAQTARAFLDPAYLHFVQVVGIGCAMTIPTLTPNVLGGLLAAIVAIRLVGLVWVYRRLLETHRRSGDLELSDWMTSIVLPLAVYLAQGFASAAFVLGIGAALTVLAVSVVGLLIIGIHSAWELLVWMAIAVGERRRAPPPE